jgi:hypothetical protein
MHQLWHSYYATDEGNTDLPADKEPASCPASSEAYKLESTVRSLGIEIDGALEMAKQTEV